MGKLLIIPLALVLMLVGSLVWSGGGTVSRRADVAYIDRADVLTLDPNVMSYMQDFRISYAFREGLYSYEFGTLKPIPAGAKSVDVSDDKRVWTFHLRPEAKWTNGDPVRAGDYVFAWRRMLESPGEYTYLFYYIRNARAYEKSFAEGGTMTWDQVGVEALDDLTLRVTLDDPVTFFLDLICFVPFYPLHAPSMEPFKVVENGKVSYRPEFTRPPHVVTNGPFEIKSWEFKRGIRLEKSDTYWDKEHVYLDSIQSVVNEERLSQVLMYESGVVDWLGDVGNDVAAELKRLGRKDLQLRPGFGTLYLAFNTLPTLPGSSGGKNPFSDIRVRKALAMGFDKQQICDNVTRLGERPAKTFVPPDAFPTYRAPKGYTLDLAEARRLLAEAGYPGGQNFPPMPLMHRSEDPVMRDIAQSIKNQLRANLGINIELHGLEAKMVRARYNDKTFAVGITQWTGDYGDPSTFTDMYLTTSQNNDTSWENPEFDRLVAEANRQTDLEARFRFIEQAEQILISEVPILPVYHTVNKDACREYVTNFFHPRSTTVWKGMRVDRAARDAAR